MKELLRHIDLLTRQRDRAKLDGTLTEALFEMLEAQRVRLYTLFQPPGDTLVGIAAERTPSGLEVHDDGLSWPKGTMSIDHYRFLHACLALEEPFCALDRDLGLWRYVFRVRATDDTRPFGFVSLLRKSPLTPQELGLAGALIGIFCNCLSLLQYSERDTLTGLLNRKTFDEHLFKILSKLSNEGDADSGALHLPRRRQAHPEVSDHWLGLIDIDHFKRINDNFGHLIGDEVLVMVANKMRLAFRDEDKLFRFGGEEFVVLLKPTEFCHAQATFNRFRERMENYDFPQVGRITVSIGFAHIGLKDTASAVMDNADRALYWAKSHGRNQVFCHEQLVAEGHLQPHALLSNDVELF